MDKKQRVWRQRSVAPPLFRVAPSPRRSIMHDGSVSDQADVLSAMLRIAEGDIRAKDDQLVLLQQIIATNEKEIEGKDVQIATLKEQMESMRQESEQFKALFASYLDRSEAARSKSVLQHSAGAGTSGTSILGAAAATAPASSFSANSPASAAPVTSDGVFHGARYVAGGAALGLGDPPDSGAPQLSAETPPTSPKALHESHHVAPPAGTGARKRLGLADDEIVPPPSSDDTALLPYDDGTDGMFDTDEEGRLDQEV